MKRHAVGLICRPQIHDEELDPVDVERLSRVSDLQWLEMNRESSWDASPSETEADVRAICSFARSMDALVVSHGAPKITDAVMSQCPNLKVVGELEGDRFARRIDVQAAWRRGIKVLDTTHGSSYPVAEWALGLILVGLRNAGNHFRAFVEHRDVSLSGEARRRNQWFNNGELTEKTVGLIGCGHMGRKLLQLLRPFGVSVWAFDPYVDRELADVLDVTFTSLDRLLSHVDVVVCLVPLTPGTTGLIGSQELDLLKPGSVFVNVSRGKVVNSDALIARVKKGDISVALDVFDPEPVPVDSPLRDLPNVFVSPHIGGSGRGRRRFFELMVSDLIRLFEGDETRFDLRPRTVANRTGAPWDAAHRR